MALFARPNSTTLHREHAIRIWRAGVAAVNSERLIRESISLSAGQQLSICGESIPLAGIRHIEVVGAGKAGAGMAAGIEIALRPIANSVSLSGWVNVPEDCVPPASLEGEPRRIHLHGARPPGINEPTVAVVAGTSEILRRVSSLHPADLCIVLVSGGGSALLALPVPEITLADKLAVIRALASDGAPIHELNRVRTQLSRVKGGRLAAACTAGRMITLVISDVIGDPLPIIASGPAVPSDSTPEDALAILQRRGLIDERMPEDGRIPESVIRFLKNCFRKTRGGDAAADSRPSARCHVTNFLVGSNQTAHDAAARAARELGYGVVSLGCGNHDEASLEGRRLVQQLVAMKAGAQDEHPPNERAQTERTLLGMLQSGRRESTLQDATGPAGVCLLSGGEPTVRLMPSDRPRKGGRNQELVLAAIAANPNPEAWENLVLLSGGTDGEDGPTDAAGAVCDSALIQRMRELGLSPGEFLSVNNSYPFFDALNGLLRTGPTHTNVMDLRIGLVGAPAFQSSR